VYPELALLSPLVPPALPLSRQCIKRRSTPGRSRCNRSTADQLLQLKSVLHVSAAQAWTTRLAQFDQRSVGRLSKIVEGLARAWILRSAHQPGPLCEVHRHVRGSPATRLALPLWFRFHTAKTRCCRRPSNCFALRNLYSITSSARSKIDRGTVRPRVFAVLRFTTISNLVGNCTGSPVAPRLQEADASIQVRV
jgi:hypothetical protein